MKPATWLRRTTKGEENHFRSPDRPVDRRRGKGILPTAKSTCHIPLLASRSRRRRRGSRRRRRPRRWSWLGNSKQGSEIANRGTVEREIRSVRRRNRVRQIVAAAGRQRWQSPIPFDELQNRSVIGISVIDVTVLGKRRHRDQNRARPITEEIDGLNVPRIVQATAFIKCDEDRGIFPQLIVVPHAVNYFADERLVQRGC